MSYTLYSFVLTNLLSLVVQIVSKSQAFNCYNILQVDTCDQQSINFYYIQ